MNSINANSASINPCILASFHCFSCAARTLSFTQAAQELHLTQSAVSHRIKKLELQLGFKLFLRFNRKLQLTEEGKQLLVVLSQSLNHLDSTIRDLRNQDISGQLKLSLPPSFANHWLAPKLAEFQKNYPRLFLHIETNSRLMDFSREAVDLAVYYGNGDYPGLSTQLLMAERLQPVCSPAYAIQQDLTHNPGNLQHCLFLHDANAWPEAGVYSEWEYWSETSGITGLDFSQSYTFDRSDLAIQTATYGQGIAMGRVSLIQDQLNQGSLVAPFNQTITAKQSYYLVCHPDRATQPAIKALMDWLKKVAAS